MPRHGERKATAEEEALFWRRQARRQARVQDYRSALSRGLVPSRVVREEAAPVMLFGWDATNEVMVSFGLVGGPLGQLIGNPTMP